MLASIFVLSGITSETDDEGNTKTYLDIAPGIDVEKIRVSEEVNGKAIYRVLVTPTQIRWLMKNKPKAYMGKSYAEVGACLVKMALDRVESNPNVAKIILEQYLKMFQRKWKDSSGNSYTGTIKEFEDAIDQDSSLELVSEEVSIPLAGYYGIDTDSSGTPLRTEVK